ncbi:MAG: polysaccharide export protein [Desulfobacula sp.]|jgi:polysaccharide biosynthesis/export protein|uniref:polysaccharide biosynthesis/export family protein n=1 Tax=Desulfobacula sp. TaxID=2593537 RepID=UPI001D953938|nr:polysaccharide export protein [Desulfobacula sp.]MBT3487188.1 polysaccharide export protein [Desulfobacula sp.]MBT3806077.1 polysaccharide export protein [Desulfobacula sp.]MBT4026750.1 polysaccharide export protein [Desulfobacula sp.]MBT4199443.1 polysaccharide export protein [Desulfobacula sp.]
MKLKFCMLFNVVFVFIAMVSGAVADDYKIGAGDVLEIGVWKNADLTRQLIVLPDGTVRFPLIGQIMVEEKSVAMLEKELKEKLEKFIPDPVLTISVLQVNSMMIYVIGKVNQPGRFEIRTNIDVLQALAVAGGLNPFAKEKEIGIFRKQDGETEIFNFNYKQVAEGVNLDQNIMLKRGDVIVIR